MNNSNWKAQTDRKEMGQLQLWESRPNTPDTVQSSPAPARDMEAQDNTQESTAQLQQIHRRLDESTLEEIQEPCQPQQ